MKCTACGCPGAYQLFSGVVCWNPDCRNYHHDIVSDSVYSADGTYVNGDLVDDLKKFVHSDDEEASPTD